MMHRWLLRQVDRTSHVLRYDLHDFGALIEIWRVALDVDGNTLLVDAKTEDKYLCVLDNEENSNLFISVMPYISCVVGVDGNVSLDIHDGLSGFYARRSDSELGFLINVIYDVRRKVLITQRDLPS